MTPNIQQIQQHRSDHIVGDTSSECKDWHTFKNSSTDASSIVNDRNNNNSINNNNNNNEQSISRFSPAITQRFAKALNPVTFLLVATPIASLHPVIQVIVFLSIIVSTSPLYFMLMAFNTDGVYQSSRRASVSSQSNDDRQAARGIVDNCNKPKSKASK